MEGNKITKKSGFEFEELFNLVDKMSIDELEEALKDPKAYINSDKAKKESVEPDSKLEECKKLVAKIEERLAKLNKMKEQMGIIPAQVGMGAKNCIVINEGQIPEAEDIRKIAIKNGAVEMDEKGIYAFFIIQFPGYGQVRMSKEDIDKKIEKLKTESIK